MSSTSTNASPQMNTQLTAAQQAQLANAQARRNLIPGPNTPTILRRQQIFSQTVSNYVAGQQYNLTVTPAPVGIITRFIVKVTASVGIGNAETQTRVQNGAAAIFSSVQYTDPQNNLRVNCPSWALNLLSSVRRRRQFAAALTSDANGIMGTGANFTSQIVATPASLTGAPPAQNAPNLAAFFEVPLAYGHDDLRGAVLANLVNATQQLQLTINPNFFVTSTDTVNIAEAGYQSSSSQLGKIGSITVTVYQEYIDQFLNMALPTIDLSTQYLLQVAPGFAPVANSDLSIPYANYRLFLSTIFRYNNAGTFNTGSDINYTSIRVANGSDLQKLDPATITLLSRELMGTDLPAGYYLWNHRQKPLFSNQFGNVSLIIQASSVTGLTSTITVFYEQLATTTALSAAGAIASGG